MWFTRFGYKYTLFSLVAGDQSPATRGCVTEHLTPLVLLIVSLLVQKTSSYLISAHIWLHDVVVLKEFQVFFLNNTTEETHL